MSSENIAKFMKSLGKHIININHALKGIKTDTFIEFICFDYHGLIVTSNKVVSPLDLEVVERYVKNVNSVNSNNVQSAHLLYPSLT